MKGGFFIFAVQRWFRI